MSDVPGPSGRGVTAPGAARKSKFVPTVPGRRKKAEDGTAPGQSTAEAAAASAEFASLIQAAGSEANWARGRGRGHGHQQRYQVTFGGAGDTKLAVAPTARYYGGSSSSRSGPGGASTSGRPTGPGQGGTERGSGDGMDMDGDMAHESIKPETPSKPPHRNVLDFTQYYPTCLPPRQPYVKGELPGYEMSDGVKPAPIDLATTVDPEERTAEELHLLELTDTEHMFLMQLPNVLPSIAASTKHTPAARKGATTLAAAANPSNVDAGSSVRELGSGKVGKLLVFKSGKVKLQMGEVLMDVSLGLTPQHRQDVAAINTNLGHCIMLGDVMQTAVVSPDIWQLINSKPIPNFRRKLLQRDVADGAPPVVLKHEAGVVPSAFGGNVDMAQQGPDTDPARCAKEGRVKSEVA